ncbi:MAG TPA: LysE family translocator [Caulobacteraceae bacterium]|jgi:threonine/homoserine/homoserine lactone efflux protein
MHWNVWLSFVLAAGVVGVIPGPAVTSIVGYALGSGRKAALASVAGMSVGSLIAMTLSLAGVGEVLRASSTAFMVLKWAGAAYLIGIGTRTLIRSRGQAAEDIKAPDPILPRTAFLSNVLLGSFHPKTLVFFIAFAPQFISAKADYWPQAAILIATFCAVVGTTDTLYALAASHASQFLRRPRTLLWSKRASGGVLIAAGVATAAAQT